MITGGIKVLDGVVVLVENMQRNVEVGNSIIELIKKTVKLGIEIQKTEYPLQVGVVIVDDEYIKGINEEYRGIDKPTDVLSFPMVNAKDGSLNPEDLDFDRESRLLMLGDIAISIETAMRQSEEYGHSLDREIAFLVTHGLLHLFGFDHETEDDEKLMFERQEQVLSRL